MPCGRADASTSTEDIKARPLCLFYFSHPFGVLSPEPPTVTALPAAFLSMRPAPSSGDYAPSSAARSSSLLSGDAWLGSSGSRRTLPPLRLPAPRDFAWGGAETAWPVGCVPRERFSLPPIEMPCAMSAASAARPGRRSPHGRPRRNRARLSGVQRMVTCLMRRNVKDELETLFAEDNTVETATAHRAAVTGTMGYLLDECPTVQQCCWSVPLRPAALAIAGAGLAGGGACCFLFSEAGLGAGLGAPPGAGAALRYLLGALGVLLVAASALLAGAALREVDALCEVYLWFALLQCAALLVALPAVALYAAVQRHFAFAAGYALLVLCVLLLSAYFGVVVANYRMTLP